MKPTPGKLVVEEVYHDVENWLDVIFSAFAIKQAAIVAGKKDISEKYIFLLFFNVAAINVQKALAVIKVYKVDERRVFFANTNVAQFEITVNVAYRMKSLQPP